MPRSPLDLSVHLPRELPRLVLRMPVAGDAEGWLAAINESREELEKWLPWAPSTRDVAPLKAFARKVASDMRAGRSFEVLIFDRQTSAFVGSVGIPRMSLAQGHGEIGYWVRRAAQGKGVISRVVVELAAFGFQTLGLARIEIRCDEENERSAAVATRLSFRYEGLLRDILPDHRRPGERRDHRVYSLLKNEWLESRAKWQREIVEPFDSLPAPLAPRFTKQLRGR